MPKDTIYIPEAEAMSLTGLKRTSLYLYRKSGEIRWTSRKTGRGIRYHKADLEKFIGL
jgi:ribosomal protein L13